MLVRLEHALNCPDLAKQMMLVPKVSTAKSATDINLVVGYNGSSRSQTALDLTLWIAHQTRLVTRKAVTVQVVYVVDGSDASADQDDRPSTPNCLPDHYLMPIEVHSDASANTLVDVCDRRKAAEPLTNGKVATLAATPIASDWSDLVPEVSPATNQQIHEFEKADRILWQARHLADEWRGSLETHLRFGRLATELRSVACQVSTTALILGCSSAEDPLIQALGQDLPFPILGIPAKIPGC